MNVLMSCGSDALSSVSGPSVLSAGVLSARHWLYSLQFSDELLQNISCTLSLFSAVDMTNRNAVSATQQRQFSVSNLIIFLRTERISCLCEVSEIQSDSVMDMR